MTSDDLLGEAVGELYEADPEEFTRRRGELAAAARSAGQAAAARQIAALRKPTRSAWMINRLVRSDPDAAARLATLGEELRAAEQSGDGARMRESSQARRELIASLVPRALAVSGEDNPPAALRVEITATFSAALADPEVAGQIQHATLLRPARRVGFGTVQPPELALVPPPAARPAARPARKPAATAPGRGRRTEAEPERRRRAEAEPERRRAEAEAERERRRAEAEAERERRRAEAEAQRERRRARAEAERTLAEADRAAQAARQAEQQQRDALQRLEQQLTEARHRLRDASAEARRADAARSRAQRALDRLGD